MKSKAFFITIGLLIRSCHIFSQWTSLHYLRRVMVGCLLTTCLGSFHSVNGQTCIPPASPIITGSQTICQGESTILSAGSGIQLRLGGAGSGIYDVQLATFGPSVSSSPLSGTIVYDPTGIQPYDGCIPYPPASASQLQGKVALIDRKLCPFYLKAINAQNAGAIGVIIVNNEPGPANTMGGTGPNVTIPVISLSQDDGNTLKAFLSSGTVTGQTQPNNITYSWAPATGLSSTTGLTVAANPATTTNYTVTATNANNCSSTTVVTVVVNTIPINISATPSLMIASGGSVSLTATGADNYQWSTGSSNTAITLSNITSTTTVSVTGIVNSCSAIATATIVVNPACNEAVVAKASSLTQTAILNATNCSVVLTGSGYGTGYQITGPGGYVFSAVYRNAGYYAINALAVKQPGVYTLLVSSTNPCGNTSSDTMTYVVTGTACP